MIFLKVVTYNLNFNELLVLNILYLPFLLLIKSSLLYYLLHLFFISRYFHVIYYFNIFIIRFKMII